jgi:hypothetical protein
VRLVRLASFASQCGSVAHEAMAAHCEIAADSAASLGFSHHVQDAVHYQYERHDGRGLAFSRRADAIPRPAQVLHLALAADIARSLSGAGEAAAMVRQRAGSYFQPDVAEAYLDLAGALWPPDDDPIPLADVFSCGPGTPADDLPGDRRLAVCEALAYFADLNPPGAAATRMPWPTWRPKAPPHLGYRRPSRTECAGPGWSTTSARSPCRTACWKRRETTPPRRPA